MIHDHHHNYSFFANTNYLLAFRLLVASFVGAKSLNNRSELLCGFPTVFDNRVPQYRQLSSPCYLYDSQNLCFEQEMTLNSSVSYFYIGYGDYGVACGLLCLIAFLIPSNAKLCANNEHVTGSWVKNKNITTKSYHCCGGGTKTNYYDFKHNTSECGEVSLAKLAKTSFSQQVTVDWDTVQPQTGGNACECDKREGRDTVNRREKYIFKPDTCSLLDWNATLFCQLLGQRHIYFEGDSLMQQTAHSLITLLRTSGATCANHTHYYSSALRTSQSRNFISRLDDLRPDIVVFGHGAHAFSEDDMLQFFKDLRQSLDTSYYRDLQKEMNISFVWRTQLPGHPGCDNFTEPYSYRRENFPVYNDSSIDPHKHSTHLVAMDKLATKIAREEFSMKVLDMEPLYSRPDAHPGIDDCLHYCLPGPVDLAATLLLQMLYQGEI